MDKIQEVLIKLGRKDLAQKYYKKINKKAIETLSPKEKQIAIKMKAKGYNYAVQISTIDGDFGEPLYFKSPGDVGPLLRTFPDYLNAKVKWSINLETIKQASWFGTELLPAIQEEFGKKLPSRQFLLEWARDAGEREIYQWIKTAPDSQLKALENNLKKMSSVKTGMFHGNLDEIVEEIQDATDRNDTYSGWMIVCDKIIKNKELSDAFENLEKIHRYHGHLTNGVKEARDELQKIAKDQAKKVLNSQDWEKVYQAF